MRTPDTLGSFSLECRNSLPKAIRSSASPGTLYSERKGDRNLLTSIQVRPFSSMQVLSQARVTIINFGFTYCSEKLPPHFYKQRLQMCGLQVQLSRVDLSSKSKNTLCILTSLKSHFRHKNLKHFNLTSVIQVTYSRVAKSPPAHTQNSYPILFQGDPHLL